MAIEVCSDKVECKVSAKRMWRAAFEDAHNCLPKAVPHVIAGVEYEGSGFKPGCVRTVHFHKSYAEKISKEKHPEHVVLYIKEKLEEVDHEAVDHEALKLEEVDHEALKVKAEVVEGGFLGVLVKHYKCTMHVKEGAHPNTCVVHWCFEYEALSEKHQPHVPLALKEVVPKGFTDLEAYLLTHPDYTE